MNIPGNKRWTRPEDYNSDVARLCDELEPVVESPANTLKRQGALAGLSELRLRHTWALRAINKNQHQHCSQGDGSLRSYAYQALREMAQQGRVTPGDAKD